MDADQEAYLAAFMAQWGMGLDGKGHAPEPSASEEEEEEDDDDDDEEKEDEGEDEVVTTGEAHLLQVTKAFNDVVNEEESRLNQEMAAVAKERDRLQATRSFVDLRFPPTEPVIFLNIRGQTRAASRRVLCQFPDSVLSPLSRTKTWTRTGPTSWTSTRKPSTR